MSFTRLHDDECQYSQELKQNQGVLTHIMDPNKYYNCNPCRIDFGVVGGNTVSLYPGNLVDLESEFRGQTRQFGKCSSQKFQPGTIIQGQSGNGCKVPCATDGLPCGSLSCRTENLKHLRECKMINYRARQADKGYRLEYPECVTHPTFAHAAKKPSKKSHKKVPVAWQGQQGEVLANY